MNIEKAKKQVKYAVVSYLSKDEFGEYRIPVERQRPIFLMGPPGIGKTDIMRQIAEEMDIALVSYSMSHHTRQSALGLPFIAAKEYGGKEYRTTEYTMSEIIASVYDVMEETGKKEGILFLDEINCISETLAPSMLQFLQYKIFGRHRVPAGWVIVTAGNPPEYNNSVRDFDLATLDRLKKIDVEPDFGAWWNYAQNEDVHTAVLTYLEIKKDDFYSVQTTVDGREFVTARSWVDLSDMMKLYEQNQLEVDVDMIRQYVQDERIARDFAAYYDLFYRYRDTYHIDAILRGETDPAVLQRAGESVFDERITVVRLLFDALAGDFAEINTDGEALNQLLLKIKSHNQEIADSAAGSAAAMLDRMAAAVKADMQHKKAANSLSAREIRLQRKLLKLLRELSEVLLQGNAASGDGKMADDSESPDTSERSHGINASGDSVPSADTEAGANICMAMASGSGTASPVDIIRTYLRARQSERKHTAAAIGNRLENAFAFIREVYGENEMLIFTTTLTENRESARFIVTYGSDSYYKYNKSLMLDQRETDLMSRIEGLEV
jgi:MoxR-like ATPase